MSIIAKDFAKYAKKKTDGEKLGDLLYRRLTHLNIDSVEEIRKLRERK